MKTWRLLLPLPALAAGLLSLWAADPLPEPPPPAEAGTLIVIDAAGKERKLKPWKIVSGTRPLGWLAPAAPKDEPDKKDDKENAAPRPGAPRIEGLKPGEKKGPTGPEALAFREENSTDYQEGVITLIPIDRVRTIDYDNEKRTVAIRVATNDKPDADELVIGSTKFVGVNRLTIEASVNVEDIGPVDLRFLGGAAEKGVRAIRFPAPKAPAVLPAGRPAFVVVGDRKNIQKVFDLQPLYQLGDGREQAMTLLLFKGSSEAGPAKVDLTKISKLLMVDSKVPEGKEVDVTLKSGTSETVTLLKGGKLGEKEATLVGLVCRVPGGYKLYPVHTITEIQFDEFKEEKKPEKKEGDKDK
jgi:hypothetical protein